MGQPFEFVMSSIFSLDGKVCVVTGGAGDLGRAISRAFITQGARVVIMGRTESLLMDAQSELGYSKRQLDYAVCDVIDADEVQSCADNLVKKFGTVDVLVTAAGIQHRQSFLDFSEMEWRRVIDTNLNGTFHCAQSFGRHMASRGTGRIIMVTSLTAEIGIPNIAAYGASRGAIKQLAKTMAVELATSGVTVNCIGPGRIATRMTADIQADPVRYERTLQAIPMGRWGKPDDVGGIAAFLASNAAGYITGQSFYVDGGWLASGGNLLG